MCRKNCTLCNWTSKEKNIRSKLQGCKGFQWCSALLITSYDTEPRLAWSDSWHNVAVTDLCVGIVVRQYCNIKKPGKYRSLTSSALYVRLARDICHKNCTGHSAASWLRPARRKIRAKAAQTKAWGFVLLLKHEKTVCFDCRKHHPFDPWQKIAGERVVYRQEQSGKKSRLTGAALP